MLDHKCVLPVFENETTLPLHQSTLLQHGSRESHDATNTQQRRSTNGLDTADLNAAAYLHGNWQLADSEKVTPFCNVVMQIFDHFCIQSTGITFSITSISQSTISASCSDTPRPSNSISTRAFRNHYSVPINNIRPQSPLKTDL